MRHGAHLLYYPAIDRTWITHAACRGFPAKLFFIERGQSPIPALRICASCPVWEECLDYSESMPLTATFGIWGGATERARRALRNGTLTRASLRRRLNRIRDDQ